MLYIILSFLNLLLVCELHKWQNIIFMGIDSSEKIKIKNDLLYACENNLFIFERNPAYICAHAIYPLLQCACTCYYSAPYHCMYNMSIYKKITVFVFISAQLFGFYGVFVRQRSVFVRTI